jgi:hypothetical protein
LGSIELFVGSKGVLTGMQAWNVRARFVGRGSGLRLEVPSIGMCERTDAAPCQSEFSLWPATAPALRAVTPMAKVGTRQSWVGIDSTGVGIDSECGRDIRFSDIRIEIQASLTW